MQLKEATIIVTGAGAGIGRALAVEFGRQQAQVVCAGRREANLQETVRQVEQAGGAGLAVPTDVTDRAQADRLAEQTREHFGAIDVLYNNAGSFQTIGPLWEVDPDSWWHDVTVNLRGPMLAARAVLPEMIRRDRGMVINMRGGDRIAGGTSYACSKVAVARLTELLAKELEAKGSAVMAMTMGPGFVHTEMTDLQIESDAGRFWIPTSRQAVELGRDRPPQACARKSAELIRKARPELNGRTFGPDSDIDQALREATSA